MKKTITLDTADPVSILGPGNRILNEFCTYYPGLEVSGKGNEILLDGPAEKIADFEEKFSRLVAVRKHKLNLTVYDVEDLFAGRSSSLVLAEHGNAVIVYTNEGKAIRARNANQEKMVKAYFNNDLIFAVGPAGTGKTYIAIALAVRALKNREVRRIILTRPAVEAGERLGFLPGDLKDKLDPYLQPLYDALGDMIPSRKLQEFITDSRNKRKQQKPYAEPDQNLHDDRITVVQREAVHDGKYEDADDHNEQQKACAAALMLL